MMFTTPLMPRMRRVPTVLPVLLGTLLCASAVFGQAGEIDRPGQGGEIDRPGQHGEIKPPPRPDVSNPKNPHDEAGRLHNEGLDYAIDARKTVGAQRGPLTIAITGRLLELGADPSSCAVGSTDLDRVARFIGADPETRYALLKETLTKEQLAWTEKIHAVLDVADPVRTAEELRKIEDEIRATLPKKDAASLLTTASIARYSTEYWHRQGILGPKSLWDIGDGNPSERPDVSATDALVYQYEYQKALEWLHPPSAHAYALKMSMIASSGFAISEAQKW